MATHGGSVSVLVVDDDPAILALIATILDRNGLRALLARDGQEAMAIAQRNHVPIDLILSDIEISGVSGADLVRRLREIRPNARVLYMSAYVDSGVIRVGLMPARFESPSGAVEDWGFVDSILAASQAPSVHTRSASDISGYRAD
jgi:CheY-like chemotaxis protein